MVFTATSEKIKTVSYFVLALLLASHSEEAQFHIIPQHMTMMIMIMMMMMMIQTTKIIQSLHLSSCLLTDTAYY
jgi:uncharacterized membrane protein YoaK (UPF0700 family)